MVGQVSAPANYRTPRDLKQPDQLTLGILERERRRAGRTFERIEVNMLPVPIERILRFIRRKEHLSSFEIEALWSC